MIIVELLVRCAMTAQVLNTITVEKKGISAVPTQVSNLHSYSHIVKHLLGDLASKIFSKTVNVVLLTPNVHLVLATRCTLGTLKVPFRFVPKLLRLIPREDNIYCWFS